MALWPWQREHVAMQLWRNMGVEPKIGGILPPKWMVYFMENPMNKWLIWGYHCFWKHPYQDVSKIDVFCWASCRDKSNYPSLEPPKVVV